MAQYMTDFSEYKSGTTPHDWVDAWVSGGQRLEVVSLAGTTGGKVLEHEILTGDRRAWAWSRVPGADEGEVLARMRAGAESSRFGVIARGKYGDDRNSVEGWTAELFHGAYLEQPVDQIDYQERRTILNSISYNPAEEKNRGVKRPHGVGQIRGTNYHPWNPGEWHWVRLQVRNVGKVVAIRVRAWMDGDTEPKIWHHDNDRTEPSSIGSMGFFGITGQQTAGIRQYDVFSVGTEGDSAPML